MTTSRRTTKRIKPFQDFANLIKANLDTINIGIAEWESHHRSMPTVRVIGPSSWTVAKNDCAYSKTNLIGDERLKLIGVRMGKTGPILMLSPEAPRSRERHHLEVQAYKAPELLDGILMVVEELSARKDEDDLTAVRQARSQSQSAERYGHEFGSW